MNLQAGCLKTWQICRDKMQKLSSRSQAIWWLNINQQVVLWSVCHVANSIASDAAGTLGGGKLIWTEFSTPAFCRMGIYWVCHENSKGFIWKIVDGHFNCRCLTYEWSVLFSNTKIYNGVGGQRASPSTRSWQNLKQGPF